MRPRASRGYRQASGSADSSASHGLDQIKGRSARNSSVAGFTIRKAGAHRLRLVLASPINDANRGGLPYAGKRRPGFEDERCAPLKQKLTGAPPSRNRLSTSAEKGVKGHG